MHVHYVALENPNAARHSMLETHISFLVDNIHNDDVSSNDDLEPAKSLRMIPVNRAVVLRLRQRPGVGLVKRKSLQIQTEAENLKYNKTYEMMFVRHVEIEFASWLDAGRNWLQCDH